jgi:hypothetical protein
VDALGYVDSLLEHAPEHGDGSACGPKYWTLWVTSGPAPHTPRRGMVGESARTRSGRDRRWLSCGPATPPGLRNPEGRRAEIASRQAVRRADHQRRGVRRVRRSPCRRCHGRLGSPASSATAARSSTRRGRSGFRRVPDELAAGAESTGSSPRRREGDRPAAACRGRAAAATLAMPGIPQGGARRGARLPTSPPSPQPHLRREDRRRCGSTVRARRGRRSRGGVPRPRGDLPGLPNRPCRAGRDRDRARRRPRRCRALRGHRRAVGQRGSAPAGVVRRRRTKSKATCRVPPATPAQPAAASARPPPALGTPANRSTRRAAGHRPGTFQEHADDTLR